MGQSCAYNLVTWTSLRPLNTLSSTNSKPMACCITATSLSLLCNISLAISNEKLVQSPVGLVMFCSLSCS